MSLEQAVHQRWAASSALAALLPAEKVTTGLAHGGTLPHATVVRKQSRAALRTNAGATLEEVTLRISIWHDEHDAGREIAEEVEAVFDGADFSLSGSQRVAHMRKTDEVASQDDNGMWRITLEFLVSLILRTGV